MKWSNNLDTCNSIALGIVHGRYRLTFKLVDSLNWEDAQIAKNLRLHKKLKKTPMSCRQGWNESPSGLWTCRADVL